MIWRRWLSLNNRFHVPTVHNGKTQGIQTQIYGKLGFSAGPNGDRSGRQATGPRGASEASLSSELQVSPSFPYYHPDYRTDFQMGDNPYRYYRW